jgi:2-polyprenyl-3-methyl-5-hydroxy-6-metoxy-1,4-benzoquinol methylase
MLLSNYIRDTRMNKIRPYVRGDVLDVGCGPAMIKQKFGNRIDAYVGVDRNAGLVEKLRVKFPDADFHAVDLDEGRLSLGGKFDTILLIAIIEHVFNQKHLFREVVRHLKPGGSIVITTPTPFGNDVVHRLGAAIGLFAKTAADDHIVIYNRRRLEILAREFGLKLETYRTFGFGCNQLAILRTR